MTIVTESNRKNLRAYLGDQLIGHELMQVAFTHASTARSYNNERLEFLGDAVLGFLIAKLLYQQFETAEEGLLTRWRSYLVRRETLSKLAHELELSELLVVGGGEEKSRGRQKESILADALEAVIGAFYLLRGEHSTQAFIEYLFAERLAHLPSLGDLKDAKSKLQEVLQKNNHALPVYEGDRLRPGQPFHVRCKIESLAIETFGRGTSKNKAEQDAAERALAVIEKS